MSIATRIVHNSIRTRDPERLRDVRSRYFGARASDGHCKPKREFRSFCLALGSGARTDLMRLSDIADATEPIRTGLTHVAFSLRPKEAVDALTERLRIDSFAVLDEPGTSGDACYESAVADPDDNRLDLAI